MNRELEKLIQQYADLYPYQPSQELPPKAAILATPTHPPDVSVNVPPIVRPIGKDIQLLPVTRQAEPVKPQTTENHLSTLCSGENLFRLVLCAILVICLIMFFRKK